MEKWTTTRISSGKIEIIYFVVHCRSQPALLQFLGEGQDKKQTLLYMWYSLLFTGGNLKTLHYSLRWHHLYSGTLI